MPRNNAAASAAPELEDVTYLFAQDALSAALRYLFTNGDECRIELLRAITAVDVAWEVAPASGRRRLVLGRGDVDADLAQPVERWLPRAKELGLAGVCLIEDGRPSIAARLLAKELLPYLFRPAMPASATSNAQANNGLQT